MNLETAVTILHENASVKGQSDPVDFVDEFDKCGARLISGDGVGDGSDVVSTSICSVDLFKEYGILKSSVDRSNITPLLLLLRPATLVSVVENPLVFTGIFHINFLTFFLHLASNIL